MVVEKEIMSAQVVFPDGRTLDQVIKEIEEKLKARSEATSNE